MASTSNRYARTAANPMRLVLAGIAALVLSACGSGTDSDVNPGADSPTISAEPAYVKRACSATNTGPQTHCPGQRSA